MQTRHFQEKVSVHYTESVRSPAMQVVGLKARLRNCGDIIPTSTGRESKTEMNAADAFRPQGAKKKTSWYFIIFVGEP